MSVLQRIRCHLSLAHEQDPTYRSILRRILHTGLRQCGIIGLVASVLYVGLGVFGLGYDVAWTYEALVNYGTSQQIIVVGLLIGAALSVIALLLSQMECSLRTGRLFGAGAILLATAVATFEGALRGAYGTEYVILIYLLVVTIIPFRPGQVVGTAGALALVVYLLAPTGVAWTGALGLSSEMGNHLVFLAGGSVLVAGASLALYLRHHSFATSQASLRKSRDRLSRTQEVAHVGGWEYHPSTNVVHGTSEFDAILSRPPEADPLGHDDWLQFFPADRRAEVRTALHRGIESGAAFDLELPLTTASGERRWVRLRGKARGENGESRRLTGILHDLTERHSMEQRLRRQRHLLRSITENVSDGIYRLVPGRGLVYVNRAFVRLFGYDSVEEVLSLPPDTLYADSDSRSHLLDVSAAGGPAHEAPLRRKDGSTFVGLIGGTTVQDEEGRVQYVDGVVTDITDLKKRERLLQGERDRFEMLFETLLREHDPPDP